MLELVVGECLDEVCGGVGHADRAHQAELGLHEQILQSVFGDRGQRTVHAERAGTMAHGMELEIAERDTLHLAIGGMIIDPVLVAPEPVARAQHRRVPFGEPRQLIEPAAGELPKPVEMRLEAGKIIRHEIELQQIAQAAIDGVEVLSRTIRRDVIGAAPRGLHACFLLRSLR